ncbi:hypothetical protein P8452_59537 [Trifolium repens]|nr:hypothetical protein P8452_59537 [Trifolium repens]
MAERRLFTAAAPGCCEAELRGVTGWNGSFLGINVDQTQVGASNFHMERRKELRLQSWQSAGFLRWPLQVVAKRSD